MQKLLVIKIGGNVIDDADKCASFLRDFAGLPYHKVLIHGGGVMATNLAETMGIQQTLVDGRRITDGETLKVITMVYAGYVNKHIVSILQGNGCNAAGFTGADGNLITAHKRINAAIDYGFVGDVDQVNTEFLVSLMQQGITPVVAPVTHDGKGQLLNTNADTIAQELAQALSSLYDVSLIYCFEKNGVLMDVNDGESVIKRIDSDSYQDLQSRKVIHSGMIPKLNNAFIALHKGVGNVTIGKAEHMALLVDQKAGTSIVHG
jgi:acetylglutamate kinase